MHKIEASVIIISVFSSCLTEVRRSRDFRLGAEKRVEKEETQQDPMCRLSRLNFDLIRLS